MQLWKNTALTSVAALLGLFLLPLAVAREPAELPEYTELPRTEQTAPVQPEGSGGGSPYLYPLQADSRQQPRGHGGHLHGLYLLSGVYRHGAGPGQLGGTGGRL